MARCRAAVCALIASVQRNSVSSCAWPPAFARSSRGLACESSWRHHRRLWSRPSCAAPVASLARQFFAALVPVVGLLDLVAFGAGGPAGRGRRRRRVDAGLGDRAGRNRRAAPCQARRRWGLSPCWSLSPCWLSSQPPSEPAASWKGSSMRARMTPTPEAPGRRRQVVCSCEGPPVRVPTPLKATRPPPSAM